MNAKGCGKLIYVAGTNGGLMPCGDEQDQISDLAQAIVEELEREICFRETAWHDIGLVAVVEEAIRRALPLAAPEKKSENNR